MVCKCVEEQGSTGEQICLGEETDAEEKNMEVVVNIDFVDRKDNKETLRSVVDLGAYSVWMDRKIFSTLGSTLLVDEEGASDAGGRKLDVASKGYLNYEIWGKMFYQQKIRVLPNLPSGILIGMKFWIRYGMKLYLENLKGTITIQDREFHGKIYLKDVCGEEIRSVIEFEDVDTAICNVELTSFHLAPKMQQQLRDVLRKH